MNDLLWMLPLMAVLMLLKAFFSGSEIALVSVDRIQMRRRASQGDRAAAQILKLERAPELLLATTLVGTNLCIVALTTIGTIAMVRLLGDPGEFYAVALLSPLFLLLTEVVPKSIFQQRAERIAPMVIWPLLAFRVVLFPIVFAFALIARSAARLAGGGRLDHVFMTRDMIRAVLETAEKAADVDVLTWNRLKKAVRLSDVTVGEVMIPMAEVTSVGLGEPMRKAVDLACARGHFRLPVIDEESGAVVGVLPLDVWKLLSPELVDTGLPAQMVPAEFVVAQQPVYELLPVLRRRDDHMAIVLDEFGSAVGMVTLEDIQEEVVGEFVGVGYNVPGYVHRERHQVHALGDDAYVLDARVPVSEVNDLLAIALPKDVAHTIGGFVTAQLRHLPQAGEEVHAQGFRFIIEESTDKVVKRLRVERA